MVKGIIDFLLSDTQEAIKLRKDYVFKIIPMLNPDGVIYGNYRCCLLGYDLNRQWKLPDKTLHPTIFHAKDMIRILNSQREVSFYCDLHAHSMQKYIFMYGCSNLLNDIDYIRKNAAIRLIPLLISLMSKHFSYEFSRFRMEKYKESTARIVLFKEFDILNSYTCEASFLG